MPRFELQVFTTAEFMDLGAIDADLMTLICLADFLFSEHFDPCDYFCSDPLRRFTKGLVHGNSAKAVIGRVHTL